jgi:predicted enzyme related to lactoylglutathione lyase
VPDTRIGHPEIGIVVRDIETVTAFYRDGLGLPHVADLPIPIGLQRRFAYRDSIIKLLQLDDAPTTSNPPGGVTGGATGLRWLTLQLPDLEEVLERSEAAGGKVAMPIQQWKDGSKFMILEDPEGSCWIEIGELRT